MDSTTKIFSARDDASTFNGATINGELMDASQYDDKHSVASNSIHMMHKTNSLPDDSLHDDDDDDELGPLPAKWQKAYTDNGETYFIDHSTGTSHWLDPRLSKFQKKSLEDCHDDELPYGWEKITDPQYGTYFIDHVNRRTQYENPVLQAKQAAGGHQRHRDDDDDTRKSKDERVAFTRNPAELCGERLSTTLLKSSRGLGFTIVGGDDDVDEFLQIKSIVANGPAWLDGKLQTGDIIVYVNDMCVLGFTHNQVVKLFQSITVGEAVFLEVCRGYPLPFDPNDPNTQVVTTVAVDSNDMQELDDDPSHSNATFAKFDEMHQRWNTSCDQLNEQENDADTVIIHITKGAMGFGFTIADSACGQRVKKILDRQRCKNLLESDILLQINNINVEHHSHDDVVQVLKNCPQNKEALIVVQRGLCATSKVAAKNKFRKFLENDREIIANVCAKDNVLMNIYRSKTPTADLYSTQPKEILPNRPKTPLVDTRNRMETLSERMSTSNGNGSIRDAMTDTKPSGYITHNDASLNGNVTCSNKLNNNLPKNLSYGELTGAYHHVDNCYCYDCKNYQNRNNLYETDDKRDLVYERETPTSTLANGHVGSNSNSPYCAQYPAWVHETAASVTSGMSNVTLDNCDDVTVTLIKSENGFGFRIVGGTEEGSQVAVGHIVPGGAADLDGRIRSGDVILSVDGNSVISSSHHQVVQLMGQAAVTGRVKLRLRRRVETQSVTNVIITRTENEGFGFVIISSANKAGSTIGRLIEGSPAEKCGMLRVGDTIVAVNHIDIRNMTHGEIVNLIKDSGYSVILTIAQSL